MYAMPGGRPREFDVDACVDVAMETFWRHGWDGTGIAELAEAMGIGRQSLYNAFGDKRQVFLTAVRRYGERRDEECREILAGAQTTLDAVRAVLRRVGGAEDAPCKGCLVSNAAPRFADADPEIMAALRWQMGAPERVFSGWIQRAVDRGELPAGADRDGLAKTLAVLVTGLSSQSVAFDDPSRIDVTIHLAELAWREAEGS